MSIYFFLNLFVTHEILNLSIQKESFIYYNQNWFLIGQFQCFLYISRANS